jgi:hypothetical protein
MAFLNSGNNAGQYAFVAWITIFVLIFPLGVVTTHFASSSPELDSESERIAVHGVHV